MLFLTNMYSEMFQMQFQKCNMVLTKYIGKPQVSQQIQLTELLKYI